MNNPSLAVGNKRRAKSGNKSASSSEVSNERALAKLRLNFRKSPRLPVLVQNPRWASPTRARAVFLYYSLGIFISYYFIWVTCLCYLV